MLDEFYLLKNPSVKKIKNLILWANKVGLKTCVDMLDCSESFARINSDKPFKEVVTLINKAAVGFFRIILRKQMNTFGILSFKDSEIKDIVEIFIRNINVKNKEYFIFIYLKSNKLSDLKNKYFLKRI